MGFYVAVLIFEEQNPAESAGLAVALESVVLIRAENSDEAWDKAESRGRRYDTTGKGADEDASGNRSLRFRGVRKLVDQSDEVDLIGDGSEITFRLINLPTRQGMLNYAAGLAAPGLLEDCRPDGLDATDVE